jgi:hypothetical protein
MASLFAYYMRLPYSVRIYPPHGEAQAGLLKSLSY